VVLLLLLLLLLLWRGQAPQLPDIFDWTTLT
jgi:hypothetical protein